MGTALKDLPAHLEGNQRSNQSERPLKRLFTLEEFARIVDVLPDDCPELIISKPEIYATLEIPAYWVIDRRDQCVWAHTAPENGQYASRIQYKGRQRLPAPGMEFLNITPAQIFGD
jgi:hypothetical protein